MINGPTEGTTEDYRYSLNREILNRRSKQVQSDVIGINWHRFALEFQTVRRKRAIIHHGNQGLDVFIFRREAGSDDVVGASHTLDYGTGNVGVRKILLRALSHG